jgi:hypothetical protein
MMAMSRMNSSLDGISTSLLYRLGVEVNFKEESYRAEAYAKDSMAFEATRQSHF